MPSKPVPNKSVLQDNTKLFNAEFSKIVQEINSYISSYTYYASQLGSAERSIENYKVNIADLQKEMAEYLVRIDECNKQLLDARRKLHEITAPIAESKAKNKLQKAEPKDSIDILEARAS